MIATWIGAFTTIEWIALSGRNGVDEWLPGALPQAGMFWPRWGEGQVRLFWHRFRERNRGDIKTSSQFLEFGSGATPQVFVISAFAPTGPNMTAWGNAPGDRNAPEIDNVIREALKGRSIFSPIRNARRIRFHDDETTLEAHPESSRLGDAFLAFRCNARRLQRLTG